MKIYILGFLLVLSIQVDAQFSNLGFGAEINVPSGNSSNVSPIGFGGGIKAEIMLSDKFAVTANGSVVSFLSKSYFGFRSPTETSVPIKGGFKYYTSDSFYLEGQLGANIPISGRAVTGFIWSPGIGTFFKIRNSDQRIDVGLRYEGWSSKRVIDGTNSILSTFGFVGIRAAYTFGL